MGEKKSAAVESKVLSVRMPIHEVRQIDADAKAAGMNRNDFIRMKVRDRSAFAKAEKVTELADALRQLTIMLDTYLSILDCLVGNLEGKDGNAGLTPVFSEIERAQGMMKLMLKTQRQAIRILRSMHDDVRR